jgi:hypothetical protein
VIALILIRTGDAERGDCLVEGVALAQVPADRRGLAGVGVSARQRPAADLRILRLHDRTERFDQRRELHVLELAHIEMPAELTFRPAEEDVARHCMGR